jgi:hypothetical protein
VPKYRSPSVDVSAVLSSASCREFPPTVKQCRAMVRRMVRKVGRNAAAGLLSVPHFILERWITGEVDMWPRDRKLVWLVHSLLFNPHLIRSPFDIITCGRFVSEPRRKS